MISIQDHATARTYVCANTKSLFDQCSTCATALAGVLWCHCNHRDIVQEGIVVKPSEEISPSCIMDRFGELMISDHIADLKLFIGNQVARRDQRVCLLSGKIFTLPLHIQMVFS